MIQRNLFLLSANVTKNPYTCKKRLHKTLFFRKTLHISNKKGNFASHFHFGKMVSSVMVN